MPRGGDAAIASRICAVAGIGAAMTISSWSSVTRRQSRVVDDPRRRRAGRIGDLDGEALRAEVAHEPAPHVAAAADHEHAPAAALARRRDHVLLLDRQRAADQGEDQLLAELRGEAVLDGGRARALDHVTLLTVVARRDAGVALDLTDPLRERLPARHEREDLAIDLAELRAERVEACPGVC